MNERIPDLGITCGPLLPAKILMDPLILIEILSPSNEAKTRANVWAYTSIPSVQEILILSGTKVEAELLCRSSDGNWPERPLMLATHDELHLRTIDYRAALSAHYETTSFRVSNA
jgi:Uma2 family endonuclease